LTFLKEVQDQIKYVKNAVTDAR